MKKIIVLGAGEFQKEGIKKLKEKGYYVVAFDGDRNAIGKEYADLFYCIDIKNHKKIINVINLDNIEPYSCICFATEIAIRSVSEINEYFNLVGLKKDDAILGTNKAMQRVKMNKLNLPTPKFVVLSPQMDIKKIIKQNNINFPIIVKPIDNSGSRGVFFIANLKELNNKIKNSFDNAIYDNTIIAEEYICGIEFTVESIISNNKIHTLAISEKKKPSGNNTVSVELFYNSPLVHKLRNKIENTCNVFLQGCGFNNGIFHTEVIYSLQNDNVYIIETGIRAGGFYIFDKILPQITGNDTIGAFIDTYLEKEINLSRNLNKSCILRFFSSSNGILQRIKVFEELIFPLKNIEYKFFKNVGDEVTDLKEDGSRIGYMIAISNTWEEAFSNANILEYAIKIEIL